MARPGSLLECRLAYRGTCDVAGRLSRRARESIPDVIDRSRAKPKTKAVEVPKHAIAPNTTARTVESIAPVADSFPLQVESIALWVQSFALAIQSNALQIELIALAVELIAELVQSIPLWVRWIALKVDSFADLLQLIAHLFQFIADLLRSIALEVELIELRAPLTELRARSNPDLHLRVRKSARLVQELRIRAVAWDEWEAPGTRAGRRAASSAAYVC